MNNAVLIQKLIQEILTSNTVDEKRTMRNQVVALFKKSELVEYTPIVIRLNTTLALKEAIDNFMVHDNKTSRESLKNTFAVANQLLCRVNAA